MAQLSTEQTRRVRNNEQITEESTISILRNSAWLFKEELDLILQGNKQTLIQIRSISDLNMPNMISRLKNFVDGLAENQMHNFKDSSTINRSFIKQYERLDSLEAKLKLHRISCDNFRKIRKIFESIDIATRKLMIQNSEVPPLF